MKKLLALILCGALTLSMTACGGSKTEEAPAAQEEAAVVEEPAEAEAEVSEEMCSDETFAALQEIFGYLTYLHNQTVDIYTDDQIAADPELEEALNESADAINQLGELTQEEISEDDALALVDAMETLADALYAAVEEMVGSIDETCSDETFATLQENYQLLAEAYNVVVDAYMSDEIEQDDEVESHLAQAKELIETLGEVEQTDLAESDAESTIDAMVAIYEYLEAILEAM